MRDHASSHRGRGAGSVLASALDPDLEGSFDLKTFLKNGILDMREQPQLATPALAVGDWEVGGGRRACGDAQAACCVALAMQGRGYVCNGCASVGNVAQCTSGRAAELQKGARWKGEARGGCF